MFVRFARSFSRSQIISFRQQKRMAETHLFGSATPTETEDQLAIKRFEKFLSFPTVSNEGPNGSYEQATSFLTEFARSLGLETKRFEFVKSKPVVVFKLPGRDPSLPAVLLNSHYDVVPAAKEFWKTEPFEPTISEDGTIYARGTQDMKCVCMQYIEAIRRLKIANKELPFLRTVYLSYLPDEEIGGIDGAAPFVKDAAFTDMNIGVALDEGLASPTEAFTVFYGERAAWWFSVIATGPTGHGSRFVPNTAAQKLIAFINKALQYRAEQEARLDPGCSHGIAKKLGDVVTLNLTALKAGVPGSERFGGFALNVIPHEAEAGFDVRVPPSVPLDDIKAMLEGWAASEPGVKIVYRLRTEEHHVTSTDPEKNHWWATFTKVMDKNGWKIEPEVFPAATDSRYFRQLGLPCLGFSPMNHTPILLHDHNESLHRDVFLKGINVYEKLIAALANAPAPSV